MRRVVNVIGGGPAGLLSAQLLARDHPDWEITVHERLPPEDTFGFGVGLTRTLLRELAAEAPGLHHDLVADSAEFTAAAFWLPAGRVELPSFHAGAIGRARLLRRLTEHAQAAGVDVRIGSTPAVDDVREESDLVIAADGVSSVTRERFAAELGASETVGRGLFMWCGARLNLAGTVFMPETNDDGVFVAHAYPYAEGLTTFVIETDDDSLRRAGCRTETYAADGDSDERSLAYLSETFAELLEGERFIGNRSRFMNFRTVRCARWSFDHVVVIGDAVATAHPTLGSGTKLALEAAIALARSLRTVGDAPPATRLRAFEDGTRPHVERLQERAGRSQLWWESFPSRLSLSPARIAFAYLSRAGAVSLEQLQTRAPDLAGQAVADYAGVAGEEVPGDRLTEWILARPMQLDGHALPGRLLTAGEPPALTAEIEVDFTDPWGPEAEATLQTVLGLAADDAPVIGLAGRASRAALLDRLALGERLRAELGVAVAVRCAPSLLSDAIDGLIAGRADLVLLGEGE